MNTLELNNNEIKILLIMINDISEGLIVNYPAA